MAFYKDPVRGRSPWARFTAEETGTSAGEALQPVLEDENRAHKEKRMGHRCSPVDSANDTASTTTEGWPVAVADVGRTSHTLLLQTTFPLSAFSMIG